MKISDFRKLKLLLNMTLSGADAERLTAIDRANDIVRKSETTWDRILDRVIKVEVEIEARDVADPDPKAEASRKAALRKRVEEAFDAVEASDPRGEAADFIASLKEQWDRRGSLSPAQLRALFKFEENARR